MPKNFDCSIDINIYLTTCSHVCLSVCLLVYQIFIYFYTSKLIHVNLNCLSVVCPSSTDSYVSVLHFQQVPLIRKHEFHHSHRQHFHEHYSVCDWPSSTISSCHIRPNTNTNTNNNRGWTTSTAMKASHIPQHNIKTTNK